MVETHILGESIHVRRADWSGCYERVRRPLGVIALPRIAADAGNPHATAQVFEVLHSFGFATLLVELRGTGDDSGVERLSQQIAGSLDWLREHHAAAEVGVFGARVVASAALRTVAQRPGVAAALVARTASPALVGAHLAHVQAATLFIVGDEDASLLQSHRAALRVLTCAKRLEVVPGAGQRVDTPGVRETVVHLAGAWFMRHLAAGRLQ